jgi:hypothetical protein
LAVFVAGVMLVKLIVMPGTRVRLRRPEHRPFVPGIHEFPATWMAGTSPAMTRIDFAAWETSLKNVASDA